MDNLGELEDCDLLWEVIRPVLDQYNPSNRCIGSLAMNLVCQIFVVYDLDKDEFLRQAGNCYDLQYERSKRLTDATTDC